MDVSLETFMKHEELSPPWSAMFALFAFSHYVAMFSMEMFQIQDEINVFFCCLYVDPVFLHVLQKPFLTDTK